jgi:serine/threonine-protein kinase
MLAPGMIVASRYRVLGLLGRGGMGAVYRAVHEGLGRDVAVKVLDLATTIPDAEARFEREARTAARLDHPGIVRVLDYGRDRGSPFLAMELLDGPTLHTEMGRAGRMGVTRAAQAIGEVLVALGHAHDRGVLHRDVKPENAMFSRREGARRLVLIDFGLARLRDEATLTGQGRVFGSVSYVAPERLASEDVDCRADLYSVGVMLYEMLAGVRPFVGMTPLEVARKHVSAVARPLRAIRPDVTAAVDAVVVRAMAKRPERRFQTAWEMLDALEEATARGSREMEPPADEMSTIAIPRMIDSAPRRLWARLAYGAWRWRKC